MRDIRAQNSFCMADIFVRLRLALDPRYLSICLSVFASIACGASVSPLSPLHLSNGD
ncbi:hypothetical protein BDQ94DRAFT_76389 [Aspergillus welwitschiae]|uniref:Uncharacterized protein n=1 Tax=Aspergillus welwitschiae TaxID=1341132 RepID=A0A3F3PU90_9EURO|nr:hypothetical protein BDQ94DRAFT_76389 [Aspergillus welwitschiae]RDH30435.1 hypothetical protein BDQ94DRAFT_76389 [Aspergillus welwitschiae]